LKISGSSEGRSLLRKLEVFLQQGAMTVVVLS